MEKFQKIIFDKLHVLAFIIVVTLIIITIVTFRFLINNSLSQNESGLSPVPQDTASNTGKLTQEVYDLIEKSKKPIVVEVPSPSPAPYNQQVLQVELLKLKAKVTELEKQLTPRSSASLTPTPSGLNQSSVKTIYIPLGTGSSTAAMDWTTVATPSLDIDPADYPGYSTMYFMPELAVYQGNGTAYARLTNSTDGVPLYGSQVSTSSYTFTPVISGSFTLPNGKKTYQVQLKTTTGYSAMLNFVKIKVVF